MTAVVIYFQVHQPYRLRRYSVFDSDPFYFDDSKNAEICRKVASKCYLPATRLVLDLVRRHQGKFRVAYSISGTALEQFESFAPEVLDLFRELARTGCVEFLTETYHHSLAFNYTPDEFRAQVELHSDRIKSLFGQVPTVFRNTELIYSNALAREVSLMTDDSGARRFYGALAEGTDRNLGYRKPTCVFKPPKSQGHDLIGRDNRPFGLLLKNYRLSDDIAFRFSNRGWSEWPLTPDKFAAWIGDLDAPDPEVKSAKQSENLCNLFLDYETFGEHQWADTGIFQFLDALPEKVMSAAGAKNRFITPTEALKEFAPLAEYDVPDFISWADSERDLSAWRGNAMQCNALEEIFRLEKEIKDKCSKCQSDLKAGDPASSRRAEIATRLLDDWRKLTTSDHFYYMCTKYFADGDVHKYFNPYDSPYDSYINFMNALDNVRTRAVQ
ncbi:MAG: glycoside hydrolase family 57 protein [Phycisphaeraceae bacterium]|nr:glycoside hydrolase family 57 protein [Phycisphaeraceae bacterium]